MLRDLDLLTEIDAYHAVSIEMPITAADPKVARRLERGSTALLAEIKRSQPRYLLFGHVHQPLARRVRVGRTECINVGHFRATGRPYVLAL